MVITQPRSCGVTITTGQHLLKDIRNIICVHLSDESSRDSMLKDITMNNIKNRYAFSW